MESLPANLEAERHIIGQALLDGHIPAGARDLSVTDFYNGNNRAAWRAFLELDHDGQEIEPMGAFEIIKRNNGSNITLPELVNITQGMIHGVNERVHVKAVKECSLKRYLIKELSNQIEALRTESGSDVLRSLKRKIDELDTASEATGHFRTLAEIIEKEVKPALKDLHFQQRSGKIPTGFGAIDSAIGGGLSLSDVLLVAGLPGSGKSAFVLQLADGIAKAGTPVAFLSGEMSDKENVLRLISQRSGLTNLNSASHLTVGDYEFAEQWADTLAAVPISMDSRTHDLQTLSKAMRGLIDTRGVKVLVIDYIQLMKLNRYSRQERYERITETSQEVKRIAMEYGVAVIEVAQFNREGAKSGRPTMHDLEGSSQLEKDTSLIFILDRIPDSFDVTLRIVKGRNTGTCEIPGRYTGRTLTFEF